MRERITNQFESHPADPAGGTDVTLDFGRMLEIVRNGWWIFAACGFMAALMSAIYVLQITPKYTARAQVLLSAPNNTTTAIENLFPELTLSSEAVAGEIAVMQSSRQLRSVSEALNLAEEAEFNPALRPPEEAPGFLAQLIETSTDQFLSLLSGPEEEPVAAAESPDEPTEISAITRVSRLEQNELGDQSTFVKNLASNLSIRRVGSSFLVDVTYTSPSRITAAAVPNAVVDTYLSYQLEQKFGASVEMTEKLTERLQDLEDRVEESESVVIEFRNEMLTAGFGGEERTQQQLRDMANRQNQAEAEFAEVQSELSRIDIEIEERGLLAASRLFDSQALNRLREEISEQQQNVNQMAQRFGADTSRIEVIRSEIASLQEAIRAEVRELRDSKAAQVEIARAQSGALREQLRDLEALALEQSRQQIELAKLERTRDANRVVYNSFLATVTEINEVSGLAAADAQVVSYASPPPSPVTPRKKETVAISMFGGMFLGVALVFFRSFLDRSVRNASQLSKIAGGRHVQVIPRMRWRPFKIDPLQYIIRRPKSSLSEGIRALRGQILINAGETRRMRQAQMKYASENGKQPSVPPKKSIISIVSATPQVGKTTTCIALARSFADMGRSCVVIDTDLRRGSIARVLGMHPKPDLVDALASEVDIQSVVYKDFASDAMIITSRDTPNDPSGLLHSVGMETLINALGNHFEIVIMDTSPLLAVSDAIPIARMSDEVIMVVKSGKTTVDEVQETMQLLDRMEIDVSSLVLSMASERDSSAILSNYVQN